MSLADAMKEGVKGAQGSINSAADLDGPSKSAVVLLAVGAEAAADVLRELSPFEVQRLSAKMAVVRALSRDLVLEVLREFRETTSNNAKVAFDTDSFMQNMLGKALGMEAASDLLGRLESAVDMSGIETLKRMEPDVLFEIIKNEHPQIIATVFVFLEPELSSQVVKLFEEQERSEILLRVALLEKVQPAALKELNEVMSRVAGPDSDLKRSTVGGVGPTADILNLLSGGIDQQALTRIREFDPELAARIVESMFTFEDLFELEDRSLQTLMLEIPQPQLVIALKGASPRLREKLLKNMAKRAAEAVREELETKGPVKVQEVEDTQKEILAIGRALTEEGRMLMQRGKQSDAFL
jgi:flagellar motor switch protein FliG